MTEESSDKLILNGSPRDNISNDRPLDKSNELSKSESRHNSRHKVKEHADELKQALSESGSTSRRKHHSSTEQSTDSLNSSSHIQKSMSDNVRHSSTKHLRVHSSGEHNDSKEQSLSESSSRRKHIHDGESNVHKSASENLRHSSKHHLKSSVEHERDHKDKEREHKDKGEHKSHKSHSSNDHSESERHHLKSSSDHSDKEDGHRSHRGSGHEKEDSSHSLKINIYGSSSHSHHRASTFSEASHTHHSSSRLNKSNEAILQSGSVPVSKSPSPTTAHIPSNPFPETNSPREHRSHGSPLKKDDPLSYSKDKLHSKKERKENEDSRDKIIHPHISSSHISSSTHVSSGNNNYTPIISIILPPNKDQLGKKGSSKENISDPHDSLNTQPHSNSQPSLALSSQLIDPSLCSLSSPVPTSNPSLSSSSLLKRDDPLSASQEKLGPQPGSPKKEISALNMSSRSTDSPPCLNPQISLSISKGGSPTGSPLSLSTLETEKPSNTPEEAIMIATNVHNKFVKKKIGLNDFERLKLIGVGGVGHVYLVRLKGTQQLFAMKTCRKLDMEKQNKIKRALTEREVLATADHPFISTLYYSFQSSTQLCFIMQYCAGGEFYRVIQRQPMKCLLEDQVKFYASEVLLALEYLHLKGFIYRDLKPENILMHATGHVLLTDFDLSKHASNPVQPRIVTKMFSGNTGVVSEPDLITNSFVGTEEYLAPEVIKGTGHNATVDWWTFGILIYEMLYGVTPFKGKNQQETFLKIQKQPLVNFPPHPRGVQVTKTVKSLLKALLTVDNKKRLGTTGGATDIKDHPFFKDIKWQLLRQITPPIVPKLSDPLDTRYFKDQQDTWEWDADEIDPTQLASNDKWKDFLDVDHGERDADGDFGVPQKNNNIFNQSPHK